MTERAQQLTPRGRTICVFIDAENLSIQSRATHGHEARLDYEALLAYARGQGPVTEAVIYTSRPAGATRPSSFEYAMARVGFRVVSHNRVLLPDGREKSLADVALALDAGLALARGRCSHLILGSGDSSFLPLCAGALAMGVRVEVIGPERGTSGHLIVQATQFTPLGQVPGFLTQLRRAA